MITKIFSPKFWRFAQTTANTTSVFEKIANFFRRKLAKIAENCDHYIDPRAQLLTRGSGLL
jgi:hypothetical protein